MKDLAWLLMPGVVAFIFANALRRSPLAQRLADRPNERSLHRDVMPRVGGIALMLGAIPIGGLHASAALQIVLLAALLLCIVSAVDDARSLPVYVRLSAHFAAAVVAVVAITQAAGSTPPWLVPLAVLAIAWMTNLFNFMDGADGLAGAMAVIGFGTLGLVAAQSEALPIAWCCGAIASASAGFLVLNFPPARVFMGDAGSIPLGFLAGAVGFAGYAEAAWTWWFPALVFSPFIVDATVTLARRGLRRERVWRAHREHAYQRLVLAGWSKRRLAASACALMIGVSAASCLALREVGFARYAIISVLVAAYGLLLAVIERRRAMASVPDRETPASGFGP